MKKISHILSLSIIVIVTVLLGTLSSCKHATEPGDGGGGDTTKTKDSSVAISTAYKTGDYYLSSAYKTDANENKIDSTKSKYSSIVATINAAVGGRTNAVLLVDSSFSTAGGFIPPPDTTYLQQQTNKDIWTYGFLTKLGKRLSSSVQIDIPPRWTNFAALSRGAGAVYEADTAHVTTMYNGQKIDADFKDSVKIIGIDTTVMEGTTRIAKTVKVLHTVYVKATTANGTFTVLEGHQQIAFWFCDAPRGIVKQQMYNHTFSGLVTIPQSSNVILLEKATLVP